MIKTVFRSYMNIYIISHVVSLLTPIKMYLYEKSLKIPKR